VYDFVRVHQAAGTHQHQPTDINIIDHLAAMLIRRLNRRSLVLKAEQVLLLALGGIGN